MLCLLLAIRVNHGVNQSCLGYIFGFKGEGLLAGDPKFEMRTAFPSLFKNYALLSGPAFGISYGVGGIFMGQLIDRYPRKLVLGMVCLGWSLASITSGLTQSFLVLCLMRFMVGVFVSATEPCAYSLLGDYFPARMRTTANSLLNTGTYLGAGLASLSVMLVAQLGWRATYMTIGGVGMMLSAVTAFALREPERGFQIRLQVQKKKQKEALEAASSEELDINTSTDSDVDSAKVKIKSASGK